MKIVVAVAFAAVAFLASCEKKAPPIEVRSEVVVSMVARYCQPPSQKGALPKEMREKYRGTLLMFENKYPDSWKLIPETNRIAAEAVIKDGWTACSTT